MSLEQHPGSKDITFTRTISFKSYRVPSSPIEITHNTTCSAGWGPFVLYTWQHEHLDTPGLALALWSHIWGGIAVVYTLGFCKNPNYCFVSNAWNFPVCLKSSTPV
jgi:hypothetical protein